jgi:hypothetical protein
VDYIESGAVTGNVAQQRMGAAAPLALPLDDPSVAEKYPGLEDLSVVGVENETGL